MPVTVMYDAAAETEGSGGSYLIEIELGRYRLRVDTDSSRRHCGKYSTIRLVKTKTGSPTSLAKLSLKMN